jgi:hypothetical protein
MPCSICKVTGHNKRNCNKQVNKKISTQVIKVNNKSVNRKNCDYQWSEFIIYLILYNKIYKQNPVEINNNQEIINFYYNNKEEIDKQNKNCDKFIENINLEKDKFVNKYIENFNKIIHLLKIDDYEHIYLTGKSINRLKDKNLYLYNIILNIPEKDRKADIFIKLKSGSFIGLSIKRSKKCQFTNWSIDSIMSKVSDINDKRVLYNERKQVLNNLCEYEKRKFLTSKEKRKFTNKLMYEADSNMNKYKFILNDFILNKYSKLFIETIISGISQSNNLPYQLLTFDGNKLIKNSDIKNYLKTNNITFIRDYIDFDSKIYNNIKKHFSATSAKLWYFILVNDEIKYRFEIRSKGDWDNSPQILIHNI